MVLNNQTLKSILILYFSDLLVALSNLFSYYILV